MERVARRIALLGGAAVLLVGSRNAGATIEYPTPPSVAPANIFELPEPESPAARLRRYRLTGSEPSRKHLVQEAASLMGNLAEADARLLAITLAEFTAKAQSKEEQDAYVTALLSWAAQYSGERTRGTLLLALASTHTLAAETALVAWANSESTQLARDARAALDVHPSVIVPRADRKLKEKLESLEAEPFHGAPLPEKVELLRRVADGSLLVSEQVEVSILSRDRVWGLRLELALAARRPTPKAVVDEARRALESRMPLERAAAADLLSSLDPAEARHLAESGDTAIRRAAARASHRASSGEAASPPEKPTPPSRARTWGKEDGSDSSEQRWRLYRIRKRLLALTGPAKAAYVRALAEGDARDTLGDLVRAYESEEVAELRAALVFAIAEASRHTHPVLHDVRLYDPDPSCRAYADPNTPRSTKDRDERTLFSLVAEGEPEEFVTRSGLVLEAPPDEDGFVSFVSPRGK